MDYKKLHDKFIEFWRNSTPRERLIKRNPKDERLKFSYLYTEVHHILPTSLGGSDDPPNLVELLHRNKKFRENISQTIRRKYNDRNRND